MTHLRHLWLLGLAMLLAMVAQFGAPPSAAGDTRGHEPHVGVPQQQIAGLTGRVPLGEGWYRELTLPAAENPAYGNGERCVKLGHSNKVLLAIGTGPPLSCTVGEGTAVFVIGITNFCDTSKSLRGTGATNEPRNAAPGARCGTR